MWAIVVMTQSYVTDCSHLHFLLKKIPLNAITHLLCFISRLTYALTLSGSSSHAFVLED